MTKHIAIIGLGLIGSSLGLAFKQNTSGDVRIVGYSRTTRTADTAMKIGAVDCVANTLSSAIEQASVVIICTPVLATEAILKEIGAVVLPGTIVTDTASTKAKVMQWAEIHLPKTVEFIGGHPMAGKEQSGPEVAEPTLFRRCTYCLCTSQWTSSKAIDCMIEFVKTIGANPMLIDIDEHDNFVAAISHLPLVISTSLISVTTGNKSWDKIGKLAAGGYRDVGRLASQNPEMNRDICLSNEKHIASWIDQFIAELCRLRELIVTNNYPDLEKSFTLSNQARARWLEDYGKRNQ
ncbi:MAG: prephenate dehydrogenase/arogenate dehydrogenase family protein [Chloroflexota bacterium]|nr:prephenate dehydrogenase/arogenate dehydrogenase family protein [Chloroflexota bacterium]